MKSKTTSPTTPHEKLMGRVCELWKCHPDCKLAVGDVAPCMEVPDGATCLVMIAKGPLMIHHYVDKSATQFLFDAYST